MKIFQIAHSTLNFIKFALHPEKILRYNLGHGHFTTQPLSRQPAGDQFHQRFAQCDERPAGGKHRQDRENRPGGGSMPGHHLNGGEGQV